MFLKDWIEEFWPYVFVLSVNSKIASVSLLTQQFGTHDLQFVNYNKEDNEAN